MSRAAKRLIIVLGVAALLIGAAIAAWKIPFLGQARQDRPVSALEYSGRPHLVGPWTQSYVENWERFPMHGVEQQGARTWQRPDGAELTETVRRFSSPTWAYWAFTRETPQERNAEYFDTITELPPPQHLDDTDGIRYFCGQIRGDPGKCDTYWVWIRYGQYVVGVHAVDAPSPYRQVPPWLSALVRDAHRALTSRAPKR